MTNREDLSVDPELMKEYLRERKREKREKSSARMGGFFKAFGKAIPKGIRHPDSLVKNAHLYTGGHKGKTRLK